MSREYYASQLNRVKVDPVYSASIQVRSGNDASATNWLTLNDESAEELIKWLQSNFKTKANAKVNPAIQKAFELMQSGKNIRIHKERLPKGLEHVTERWFRVVSVNCDDTVTLFCDKTHTTIKGCDLSVLKI